MAYTQDDLDAINDAIASGKKKIRLGQREVEYNSIEQLLKAKEDIQQEIIKNTLTKRRPSVYLARSTKGL